MREKVEEMENSLLEIVLYSNGAFTLPELFEMPIKTEIRVQKELSEKIKNSPHLLI